MNQSRKIFSFFAKATLIIVASLLSATAFSKTQPPLVPGQDKMPEEVLRVHNKLRAKHHAPSLVWDKELQDFATKHARTCVFLHSSPHVYGENLAAGYSTVSAAILAWYVEGAQYSYQNPKFEHSTGHFTQLVWVASKKIGCGYVVCNGKNGTPGNYLVCEYSPAGNTTNPGYFEKNVLDVTP